MANVYYCANENEFKKVAVFMGNNDITNNRIEDYIDFAKIYGCDAEDCCNECERMNGCNDCWLVNHLDEQDITDHFRVYQDIEYPCIVVISDTEDVDEIVTIVSVSEAKYNTMYNEQ